MEEEGGKKMTERALSGGSPVRAINPNILHTNLL